MVERMKHFQIILRELLNTSERKNQNETTKNNRRIIEEKKKGPHSYNGFNERYL